MPPRQRNGSSNQHRPRQRHHRCLATERRLRLRRGPRTARGRGRARGREPGPAAPAPRAERYPVPRLHPGSRLTERPRPPRTGPARWPPMTSASAGPPRYPGAQPMARRAGFPRFRRHPRPGPAPALDLSRELREPQGFRDHRGLRPPRRISADQGPARLVPRPPGPLARAPPGLRVARRRGLPRRGRPDLALPGQVLPGRADPARPARVPRVPARGRVTTRSAQPRPAWDQRRRPGPRGPFRASLLVVRGSRRAAPEVPRVLAVRALGGVGQAGPASPTDRDRAARDRAAPGRAR